MNKNDTLQILRQHKAELMKHYDVNQLSLFGSTVRNQARADSDIDILVSFNGAATSKRYFGVQFYLEDLLGHSVDLVTDKSLRAELRPYIEKEAIHVWHA